MLIPDISGLPREDKLITIEALRYIAPSLKYVEIFSLDRDSKHLVLDDLTCQNNNPDLRSAINTFEKLCEGNVKIQNMMERTTQLLTLMSQTLPADDSSTVLIVPGGTGAKIMQACLPYETLNRFPLINISVSRTENPQSEVTTGAIAQDPWDLLSRVVHPSQPVRFLVFDDVIATASTLRAVKEATEKAGFRNSTWYAAAPALYSPLTYEGGTAFLENTKDFEGVYATLVLHGVKPTSFNRLSSFLRAEKGHRLRDKCLENYVQPENHAAFEEIIGYLQEGWEE